MKRSTPAGCVRCARPAGYRLAGDGGPLCTRHAVLDRHIVRRAFATALVVGTALTAINQGDALLDAAFSGTLLWKIPLTYCVPYCVTTWGALGGARIEDPREDAAMVRQAHPPP